MTSPSGPDASGSTDTSTASTATPNDIAPGDVLAFWFETLEPSDWYRRSDDVDARIVERFEPTYRSAAACELESWRDTAEGRLAEIIVLDQFPRNMFRDSGEAFAADPLALALSQEAVRAGADRELDDARRAFLYMPYMHSESALVHERAMELFADLPENLEFEKKHKVIIDRFGRYPHRNAALGRESTPEEARWLETNEGF